MGGTCGLCSNNKGRIKYPASATFMLAVGGAWGTKADQPQEGNNYIRINNEIGNLYIKVMILLEIINYGYTYEKGKAVEYHYIIRDRKIEKHQHYSIKGERSFQTHEKKNQ